MYYGFRCYNQEGKPMGWLYTAHQESELNCIDNPIYFDWCKRWKTEQGAKKNFDYYHQRWQLKSGGYLQIELMPEIVEQKETQNRTSQQKWDAKHPYIIKQSKVKYDKNNPVWSFRPTSELRDWLEKERWNTEEGKPETNAQLVIRKLNKLKQLESQGY
ncbi:hypothetical protein [Crocosphaera sp. XPORK-15E]|uniref:hypothetical protein n=1 Tax=Crocosphaera sp. XPORK-15E TaxID=3110247 RepID=UPI002B1E90AC|nr:hypothetical protein [Crocosphaera sp. XPORK-15E]MEA5536792.1 hypothetical protein [Crocosphaera sp. XPORK-15E]